MAKPGFLKECCDELIAFLQADDCLQDYTIKKVRRDIKKEKLSIYMAEGKKHGVCILVHPVVVRNPSRNNPNCVRFDDVFYAITIIVKSSFIADGDWDEEDLGFYLASLIPLCFRPTCLGRQCLALARDPFDRDDYDPDGPFDCRYTVRFRSSGAVSFSKVPEDPAAAKKQMIGILTKRKTALEAELNQCRDQLTTLSEK